MFQNIYTGQKIFMDIQQLKYCEPCFSNINCSESEKGGSDNIYTAHLGNQELAAFISRMQLLSYQAFCM